MKLNFVLIPFIAVVTMLVGGALTAKGVRTWYKTLRLPSWTPGGRVIGTAWTVLYILSAAAALIVWNLTPQAANLPLIALVFILNAAVNIFWSYLFFSRHKIYAAIWDALLLDVTVLVLIDLIAPVSALAAWLLAPYAAWVTFASFLNYRIWLLNKGA